MLQNNRERNAGAAAQRVCTIGLVNNVGDAALPRTEAEFTSVLSAALGAQLFRIVLFSLPAISRGPAAAAVIAERYAPLGEIDHHDLDAIIITGAEPKTDELRDEPCWDALCGLFAWIDNTRTPAAYSCLAAHAAALYRHGITRKRLPCKRFGVFEHRALVGAAITSGLGPVIEVPHSRWHEMPISALEAAGYRILTWSEEAGVDMFSHCDDPGSLYFQGHPEYARAALQREYVRDVRRYLSGSAGQYPVMPSRYFAIDVEQKLRSIELSLRSQRDAELPENFPALVAPPDIAPWHEAAGLVWRNWFRSIGLLDELVG